ncbi:hypothetical protein N0406_03560 [Pseudomonas aeruginosa]|nr:hypothetical protein [Pseudomonas aeruginosa]
MLDIERFVGELQEYIARAVKPLSARIESLETECKSLREQLLEKAVDEDSIVEKLFKAVPKPKDGEPGKDADMEALKSHLEELVKAIPAPQDGQSVTVEDVAPLIREEVAKAVAEVPPAKDGESVTVDDVRPILADLVGKAVADLPPPAPGKDADMEALRAHLGDLVKGIQLPTVPSIDEVAATFERRFSDLALSWERQQREAIDKALDKMPAPKDGRDALSVESFDMVMGEDGRTVTVKLQAGDVVVEKSVKIASVIDRGVFSAEKSYEQGDGTTYGGCYWIAQKDAPAGVPGGSDDWRLAVKKGRDGKDLRDNASRRNPNDPVKI